MYNGCKPCRNKRLKERNRPDFRGYRKTTHSDYVNILKAIDSSITILFTISTSLK